MQGLTDPATGAISGQVYVEEARLEDRPSFLDFVLGGCELNFLVGIDFTASNGDPSDPKSLHWTDPDGDSENQYQAAIRAVGEVIENYDTDRLFPVFGFGGKFPSLTEPQCHCVNISPGGNPVQGVEGVLDAYTAALSSGNVQLHGPTKLGPVLTTACRWAEEADVSQDNQKYFVLLLLTDGGVTDYADTVRALVDASHLPLSVLIVGVGDGNFGRLEYMDGEERLPKDDQGNEAVRQIAKFVALRDVAGNPTALAAKLLQELPGQVLDWLGDRNITPNFSTDREASTTYSPRGGSSRSGSGGGAFGGSAFGTPRAGSGSPMRGGGGGGTSFLSGGGGGGGGGDRPAGSSRGRRSPMRSSGTSKMRLSPMARSPRR